MFLKPVKHLILICSLGFPALWTFPAFANTDSFRHEQPGVSPTKICMNAARRAEISNGIPKYLMSAIAITESGRWDQFSKQGYAWPWTVTAGGNGKFFRSKVAAVAHVDKLRARGRSNIDIGCFQINQHYHPNAFPTLQEGFDAHANAEYAARFLKSLRRKHGSWTLAVAVYHSSTPAKGLPYRNRVYNHWQQIKTAARMQRQMVRIESKRFRRLRQSYVKVQTALARANGKDPSAVVASIFATTSR